MKDPLRRGGLESRSRILDRACIISEEMTAVVGQPSRDRSCIVAVGSGRDPRFDRNRCLATRVNEPAEADPELRQSNGTTRTLCLSPHPRGTTRATTTLSTARDFPFAGRLLHQLLDMLRLHRIVERRIATRASATRTGFRRVAWPLIRLSNCCHSESTFAPRYWAAPGTTPGTSSVFPR